MDEEFEALYGTGSAVVSKPAGPVTTADPVPGQSINAIIDEDDLFNQLYGDGPPQGDEVGHGTQLTATQGATQAGPNPGESTACD